MCIFRTCTARCSFKGRSQVRFRYASGIITNADPMFDPLACPEECFYFCYVIHDWSSCSGWDCDGGSSLQENDGIFLEPGKKKRLPSTQRKLFIPAVATVRTSQSSYITKLCLAILALMALQLQYLRVKCGLAPPLYQAQNLRVEFLITNCSNSQLKLLFVFHDQNTMKVSGSQYNLNIKHISYLLKHKYR